MLMDVLAECVKAMKKEDIKTYHSNLFTLFLEALDFRTHHNQEVRLGSDSLLSFFGNKIFILLTMFSIFS